MKARIDTTWRIVIALAMVLVLMPALVALPATPVNAQPPPAPAPQMSQILPPDESCLTNVVELTFDFYDNEGDIAYLELDVYGPPPYDTYPTCIQVTFAANETDPYAGWTQDDLDLMADMGVSATYDDGQEKWVVTVDTEETWDGVNPWGQPVGGPCWPAGSYDVHVEVGDALDNQWGDCTTMPDYALYEYDIYHEPPEMIDAITGWTWEWGYMPWHDEGPSNTNTRTSIMVVFSEKLQPASVQASDFSVETTYIDRYGRQYTRMVTPDSAVYHSWQDDGYEYGLVFLELPNPMATDAAPLVTLVDEVLDPAGNSAELDELYAQDGIAPWISLSYSGSPYQGGTIAVTATATEPLTEAYLYWADISYFPPTRPDYLWEGAEPEDWLDLGWVEMELQEDQDEELTIAYYEWEMEAIDPQTTLFVEVAAHDGTMYWSDMDSPGGDDPGWWVDPSPCENEHPKWWKHEKWTQESLFLEGKDTIVIHLWEGWNLISVPRTPVDPSLRGVFGDIGVTKVYTYRTGRYGSWSGAIYDQDSGNWETPRGLGRLTEIEPGKGYWVYCSPSGEKPSYIYDIEGMAEFAMYLLYEEVDITIQVSWTDLHVEVEPAGTAGSVPPSYPLRGGWNLIGVPVQGSLDLMEIDMDRTVMPVPRMFVSDYLSSLDGNWQVLYWYLPPVTVVIEYDDGYQERWTWPGGYLGTTPGDCEEVTWKVGFWLGAYTMPFYEIGYFGIGDVGAFGALTLGVDVVQDTWPVVMPGYGYWVYIDETDTFVPSR